MHIEDGGFVEDGVFAGGNGGYAGVRAPIYR